MRRLASSERKQHSAPGPVKGTDQYHVPDPRIKKFTKSVPRMGKQYTLTTATAHGLQLAITCNTDRNLVVSAESGADLASEDQAFPKFVFEP
jgi:hypothetical protein